MNSFFQKSHIFLGFIMLLLFNACTKQEAIETAPFDFYLKENGKVTHFNTVAGLNDYVLTKIEDANITIQKTYLDTGIDEQGEFKMIRAVYILSDGRPVNMVIPLDEVKKKSSGNSSVLYSTGGCTMTCTPTNGCGGCDQTITRRCAAQICNCTQSSNIPGKVSGCDSSIKFEDDK